MTKKITILFIILTFIYGCASTTKRSTEIPSHKWRTKRIVQEIKTNVDQIDKTDSRKDKIFLAKQSHELAEECVMKDPEEAACYYWRAVSTGLYYQSKVVGYQEGIKSIVSDCLKSIKLDPSYEHGGAYRILGKLYTELPAFAIRPNSVTRDLDLAEKYLSTATHIAPQYPENRIFLTETLLVSEKIEQARQELETTEIIIPQWNGHKDFNNWKLAIKQLEKKIKKNK
ncbi:tetratricopeptide repeat protein [bacterium]|nr:tetratricopeptide repeat protein [bacterium]